MKILAPLIVFVAMAASASAKITDPTCGGVLHGVASNAQNQPVPGINLVLWPIDALLAYILPTTKTNEAGAYSFENVCTGRFTVVVDDERAGYPMDIWNYVLGFKHEIDLTPEHSQIELPVLVPPKAAVLNVVAHDSSTKAPLLTLEVEFRTSHSKMYDWLPFNYDSSKPLLVPADTELLCRVAAHGYREWKGGGKRGKPMRLTSEEHVTLDVELVPLH